MKSKYRIITQQGTIVPHTITQFAGGEWQVEVDFTNIINSRYVVIEAHIRDGDIMPLALLVDAIREATENSSIYLWMPYLPYARQDRRMKEGQALSVKVFANFINSLNFDRVDIENCHSDVGVALINNAYNEPIRYTTLMPVVDALIAPDFGATKKTHDAAKRWDIKEVIQAGKMRNVATGELSDPIIFGNVHGKDVLVIDDICDGGRTFLQLATALKEAGANNLYLHVTHGIFSYGAKEKLKEAGYEVTATYDWTKED